MKFLHIDNEAGVKEVNKAINNGKHVFILAHMETCGHCVEVLPKWKHLENVLAKKYANNDRIYVVDIKSNVASNVTKIGSIEGYPTMKYIGNKGKTVEPYEECRIPVKDRSTDSFIAWIENKTNHAVSQKGGTRRKTRRTTRRNKQKRTNRTNRK